MFVNPCKLQQLKITISVQTCVMKHSIFFCRYDLCNYYGLYVINEANIETHGFDPAFVHDTNHPAHHEVWLPAMMSRATRMYDRDKNQPCIIMWSLGNEAGYGAAHDAMAAWLRRTDPTRPVHYEVRSAPQMPYRTVAADFAGCFP